MDGTGQARRVRVWDRLEAALDAPLRIAIITTAPDGTITAFGRGAAAMLGVDADAMVGTPLSDICSLGTPEALARAAAAPADEPPIETRDRGAGGLPLDVSLSVAPITAEDGTRTGYLVIASDITEVRRRERGVEALRRIATAVAVETPLTALAGLAARELADLLNAEAAGLVRVEGDDVVEIGTWCSAGVPAVTGRWRPIETGPLAIAQHDGKIRRGPAPVAVERMTGLRGGTKVTVPVSVGGGPGASFGPRWAPGASRARSPRTTSSSHASRSSWAFPSAPSRRATGW